MREIKFRVWSKLRDIWVNPVLDITNDFNLTTDENRVFEQYTGLKDKNGVEIYECDIVQYVDDDRFDSSIVNGYIIFENGTYKLALELEKRHGIYYECYRFWNDGSNDWYTLENANLNEIEVIGNIHENKDLLK